MFPISSLTNARIIYPKIDDQVSMASAASREADRLDRLETPARETERQKKQAEDEQALQEKARLTNKPKFHP